MKKLLTIATAIALVLLIQTASAVDATSAWNQYNEQYNFAPYPQSSSTTFAQAYYGTDFERDADGIAAAVSASLMGTGRDLEGDDLVNATLLNW